MRHRTSYSQPYWTAMCVYVMHDQIIDINIMYINSQILVTFIINSILLQAPSLSAQESILGPCLWDESIIDSFKKVLHVCVSKCKFAYTGSYTLMAKCTESWRCNYIPKRKQSTQVCLFYKHYLFLYKNATCFNHYASSSLSGKNDNDP